MPPQELDCLLPQATAPTSNVNTMFLSRQSSSTLGDNQKHSFCCCSLSLPRRKHWCSTSLVVIALISLISILVHHHHHHHHQQQQEGEGQQQQLVQSRTGPYQLSERQVGDRFLDFYSFYEGEDSLGSAGFNTYTAKQRSLDLGLINVTVTTTTTTTTSAEESAEESFVYLSTLPTDQGPRESVRLEGIQRWDAGLFILDLDHMPAGCGQWPAFWLTDEDHWPDHGEIDVVEGVNYQAQAKTALHTADQCRMFAHVPAYAFSGNWDRATGLPDTFTGIQDWETNFPADNVRVCCFVIHIVSSV